MFQFHILYALDLLGTVTFAISGTLLAIDPQQKNALYSLRTLLCGLCYGMRII